jgi:hypothetical protein
MNCHFCCLTAPPTEVGRYLRTSFRPCLRTLWVGLAKSGQRRAEGPPLAWIKFGPDFLCRSRLTQTTLGVMHKATGTFRQLVISITKITVWSSLVGEAHIYVEMEPNHQLCGRSCLCSKRCSSNHRRHASSRPHIRRRQRAAEAKHAISEGVRDAQGMRLTLKAQNQDLAELTHPSRPRVSEHLMGFDK